MRTVTLNSLDDYQEELNRISLAHENNTLVARGNWTPGQLLGHLASWIEYGYTGYPMSKLPSPLQWVLRFGMRRILSRGMKPGSRIPGTKTGTVGDEVVPFDVARDRLRVALTRLQAGDEAKNDSPAFGKMTHSDRVALNLRHAELHLSFLDPAGQVQTSKAGG